MNWKAILKISGRFTRDGIPIEFFHRDLIEKIVVFAKRRVITRFELFEYLPLETSLSLYTLSIAHFFERVRKLKGAGEWWRGERTLERASVRQAHVALINNAIIRRGASSVTLFGS